MPAKLPITGGCACGAVRYVVNAEPVLMLNCHCRDCQRATGGAYAPVVVVPRTAVQITGELRYYKVTGESGNLNQELEQAGRVADFLEFGELLCLDALQRQESCGGHFRVEYQEEGECKRDDENFAYVAAWEYQGDGQPPKLNKEPLVYEEMHMSTRSYK